MLSAPILKKIAPRGKPDLFDALINQEPTLVTKYGIDTPLRMSHFLAQTAHESGGFRTIVENLNYKVEALADVFGDRITDEQAEQFGRDDDTGQAANQAAIADIVYGGDWGEENLGNTEPGDGSKFLGRGLIQITGRSNYTRLADALGKSLDDTIAYLLTPAGAVESAAWFWKSHKLNERADRNDIEAVTKIINPALKGLTEREGFLTLARANLPDDVANTGTQTA